MIDWLGQPLKVKVRVEVRVRVIVSIAPVAREKTIPLISNIRESGGREKGIKFPTSTTGEDGYLYPMSGIQHLVSQKVYLGMGK